MQDCPQHAGGAPVKGAAFVAMAGFLLVACGIEAVEDLQPNYMFAQGVPPCPPSTSSPALSIFVSASSEASGSLPSSNSSDAGVDASAPSRTPVGACVSFQAVTCTVFYANAGDHLTECGANGGTWREDGNCFDRDQKPMSGCELADRTEWFFSHYFTATEFETKFATDRCADEGGRVL